MENINSWSDVNWSEINTRIYRLQVRIYRASQNVDRDKTHKSQKLLTVGDSAKLVAVRKVIQEDEVTNILEFHSAIYLSLSKRFELARSLHLQTRPSRVQTTNLQGKISLLAFLTLEDRAKQALVSLDFQPQWASQLDPHNTELRSGRSVTQALEVMFSCISKNQKEVLEAYIERGFDTINYIKLIAKWDTFPSMEKQLQDWGKARILDRKPCAFPEIGNSHRAVISSLLSNIGLHSLQELLESYANSVSDGKRDPLSYLSYVRNFVIIHPDLEVIQKSRYIIMKFLKKMDLRISTTKSKIVNTFDHNELTLVGFQVLRFYLIQRQKYNNTLKVMFTNPGLWISVATSLISSKEFVNAHKANLRKIIKKHKGVSQENLIYNLNPIIRDWALSKRTQISSKVFSEMDKFIYLHLWNWARKRHPNMAHTKIKDKYWNIVGNSNWVFGTKTKKTETGGTKVSLRLQKHSEIKLQKAYTSSRSFSFYVRKCELLDNKNGCTQFTTPIYETMKSTLLSYKEG